MAEPMSVDTLLEVGQCCGFECTNCPYDPRYTAGNTTVRPQYEERYRRIHEDDQQHEPDPRLRNQ